METCPKILGSDFELANALETNDHWGRSAGEAARRLLDEVAGYPRSSWSGGTAIEWGRRFLAGNGGSAYIDSDHLEINTPEHTRAADHAAHIHAGLAIARRAQLAATAKHAGERLNVMACVSDGRASWGHHLNVCVTRRLWDDLFGRKPHLAGFLATHLATATLFTGQGQVGAGNDRAACDFQLGQRPDWFEELVGLQTTHSRPLLNLRDESHAGPGLARMHIIFFDLALCPIANFLKAGTTQLVLALAEAGWIDPAVTLDDPLAAAWEVSRDLTLKKPLRLAARGRSCTAVEVQRQLADLAEEFVSSGKAESCVPDAAAIVTCWRETLELLARRNLGALARRCDWALKYLLLDRQRGRRGLAWKSPEMKVLDLQFGSLDPNEGLFLQMARAGLVEGMPTADEIDAHVAEPPEDTRAFLRAHVLRKLGDQVAYMDWDRIRFRVQSDRYWSSEAWLMMPDPAGHQRSTVEKKLAECRGLNDLIEAFGSQEPPELKQLPVVWGRTAWGEEGRSTRHPSAYGW